MLRIERQEFKLLENREGEREKERGREREREREGDRESVN